MAAWRQGAPRSSGNPIAGISIVFWLRTAWLAGSIVLLLRIVSAFWRMRSMRRTAVRWTARDALVIELARDAGVRRSIETGFATDARAPLTMGLVRPAIVLADRRTDLGGQRSSSRAGPRDRAHSPQRLDRPHAGARRLRDLLVPSARVDGLASPSPRLGAGVRRRRAAAC